MANLAQRAIAEEQMDAPGLAPDIYAVVLADLEQVNRWTFAARPTLNFLARTTKGRKSFSLLDVGYGEGGMLRAIAQWAEKRGIEAKLVGIDLNPKSQAAAEAQTPGSMAIDYRTGDYADCEPTDFIISNLVAHHMSHNQLVAFLRFMEAKARCGWMINDLHRHRFAHFGYPLLARLMGWHPIVRADGQLSIARSYRPDEWPPLLEEAGIALDAVHIVRRFPFRLCVERTR
jgi:2-polyprenyl-3-methyl-5-hydroxy-6-metoxy-1,4-benzoquinol methylase